jgi:hypothetical protein
MRRTRLLLAPIFALTAALALGSVAVAPAVAAVSNDSVGGAIALAIPDSYTEDTTGANQSDADEVALNQFCGAPVVEHGVWFSVTPSTDGPYAFDTTASDYSAGMMVFDGAPSANSFVNCGPGLVIQDLIGGHTYNILAFGDGLSAETSGSLTISTRVATPAPDLSLTINKSGSVDHFGTVHIWGAATCTSVDGSGQVLEIFGDVTQRVGRMLIHGSFDTSPFTPCDGIAHRWDAYFSGDNGIFAGGKAISLALGFGCTDLCSDTFVERTIQLSRNGK